MKPENIRQKQWQTAPTVPATLQQRLSHIPPIVLQLLYNRGLVDEISIRQFLEGVYLHSTDPFEMAGMQAAVDRLRQAVEKDEMVVVFGDFDADGVTSTVLLTEALRGLGVSRRNAQPYIPDRIKEGYGLNIDALTALKEKGASLIITVDCGIRSVAEVAHANEIGLDVIITDHHGLGETLPDALTILNPKRPDCAYPEKMLAGVGIAYKLAQALHIEMATYSSLDVTSLLDLVAIGTVADLAPLVGENRQLVINGLKVLNEAKRPGIFGLAAVARVRVGEMTAESIGFGLAPRINAAGRLDHAYQAARLLSAPDRSSARELAQALDKLNKKRQKYTRELSAQAEMMVSAESPILIAASDQFLPGVVGLIAGYLSEKFYRPTIVLETGESESRASCRSIPEFHITEALDQVADLLVRHGGHAQAAGFTILNENLPEFTERITALADAQMAGQTLVPTLTIDAEVPLHAVDWAFHGMLAQLEPTGYANPKPTFLSRGVKVYNYRTVGQDKSHLQLEVGDDEMSLKCIAFGQGTWATCMPSVVDIVYNISINEWRGRRTLQLMVKDIQAAASDEEAPTPLATTA